ncbi:Hypothetical predicted protein [Mytilus galloprovincialis]|uniref:WHEP-TRS domain-containing protein n=2 Tax=Mytilus galloprovincialis TaxID=29158 RepID=A0A8B6D0X8_MYTGA|nr:Hypothetical predicted protein [Mytilus galloprovincialis]VDI11988.1 Hypothetical predicted protein [Mytilus galloprovincialis]VDI11989.1 Hypothetical predicted protein [Mytilus galloprovincialis]VDI11990.1 Hypothetical predicted protein [Mytilus galloprovincialis]VDI11991.1 Hypothetical predicted protein [Mytilus galloprovincialis]
MNLRDEDKELLALINRELQTYIDNMEQAILRDSIRNIMSISRLGNQFMQSNKPWVLVKGSADDKSRSGTVVSLAVNIANLLSVLLQPYMPETSQTIQTQLNTPPDSNVVYRKFVCHLPPGHKIGKPSPLFQKIEACKIEEFKKMFAGQPGPETKPKRGEKTAVSGPVNTAEVQRLTDEVTKQGLVVRDLKSKKAEKSLIDSEVAKLLDLKKSLAAVPVPASNGSGNNAEVDRLTDEVTKQGLVVRDLKSKKAEKSLIDSQVAKLLDLKKRLALAGGQNPQEAAGGGKKKGKKK